MVPMDLGIIRPRQPAMGRGCAGVEVRTLVGMEFPSIRSTHAVQRIGTAAAMPMK